ncbi:MAG: hypothetical protein D4R76_04715 [Methylococcus sp.]|nr:MAG: hypothetical protein D4R76_04715 [Methylococcus sp.]
MVNGHRQSAIESRDCHLRDMILFCGRPRLFPTPRDRLMMYFLNLKRPGLMAGFFLLGFTSPLSLASTGSQDSALLETLLKNGVINQEQFASLSKASGQLGSNELIDILAKNGAITKDQAKNLGSSTASADSSKVGGVKMVNADTKKDEGYVHLNEKGLEFGSQDGNFKAKIGGRVQVDSQVNWNDKNAPPGTDLSNGVGLRRARLFSEGLFFGDYEYRFEYDFVRNNGGTQGITDAFVKYIHFKPIAITIGQQNEGKSLDSYMSNNYLTFIERSLPNNAFIEQGSNSKYQLGLTAETFEEVFDLPYFLRGGITTESLGAPGPGNSSDNTVGGINNTGGTNGTATNANRNGFSGNTSYQLVGRGVLVPFKDEEGNLLHTGLWGSGRVLNHNYNQNGSLRTGGWSYQSQPDTDVDRTNWINTGNLTNTKCVGGTYNSATGVCAGGHNVVQHQANSVNMFGAELAGAYGPFHTTSEFMMAQVNGYNYSSADLLQGFYVSGGWFITGETRPYDEKKGTWNRLIPRSNFLSGDGWGAWEVATRYDLMDMNTKHINGGAIDIGTLALNWYMTPRIRFMTNWVHVFATNTSQALKASGSKCNFPAQGASASIGCFNGLSPNVWETAVRIDF